MNIKPSFLSLHGHFYQPPYGDPFGRQAENANASQSWYEAANANCYHPNAALGNFERISFSAGNALLSWLAIHDREVYQRILMSDRLLFDMGRHGNAVAVPLHHTLLPLADMRDKLTQVRWGIADFVHRFGRRPRGMWLPEMAVDMETLAALHDAGIQYTILSQAQTYGAADGSGPYWVELPAGGRIAVYVRDDELSNQVAFNLPALGGAGRWARDTLLPRLRAQPRMTLLALGGETFGLHHPREETFLHWLLSFEAPAVGYRVTTLDDDFQQNPPQGGIAVRENTTWNLPFGMIDDALSATNWRQSLRAALGGLALGVDEALASVVGPTGVDPWALRDDFVRVMLRHVRDDKWFHEHGIGDSDPTLRERVLMLMQANWLRQRMFTSAAFLADDLEQAPVRQAIHDGAQAADLVDAATGTHLAISFQNAL